MTTPPVHRPRARRSSGLRRLAALGVAGAFLLFVTGCTQSGQPDANLGTGPTVLGVFEFEFGGLSTGQVTTSVRRIDVEEGIGSSALGTTPLTGITVDPATASGGLTCGTADYLFSVFPVTSSPARTGVTFIGYASQGFSIDGSAFAEVADGVGNRVAGAATITPSIGGLVDCEGGVPELTNPQDLATVVYDATEIADLDSTLSTRAFVDTVFPYGFVASNGADREVGTTGELKLGFRVPSGVELVRWRAVAVLDGAHRLALPVEFDARDVGGTDNLAEFLGQAGRISQANGNASVEAVVMGQGDRALVAIDADDWISGSTLDLSILDLIVVPDVRLAGPSSGATSYWIGDGVGGANENTSAFGQFAVEFKTPTTEYTFVSPVSPEGTNLSVATVGGGGAGSGATANNSTESGGGGGAYAGRAILGASGSYPVRVGSGGTGGTTDGTSTPGQPSTFGIGPLVRAAGGAAGTFAAGGAGGAVADSIGDVDALFAGGDGSVLGGGGGGAGTGGAGAPATTAAGGAGTATYGGDGGTAPTVAANGNPGLAFGGAGSGATKQSTPGGGGGNPDRAGGAGAPGIVVVTYQVP